MYGLFLNTYHDYPGETGIVRVSAVKESLVNSVKGETVPLLSDAESEVADKDEKEHYCICEVEEI